MQNPEQTAALPAYESLTIYSDRVAFATARVAAPGAAAHTTFCGLPAIMPGTYGVGARDAAGAPLDTVAVEHVPADNAKMLSTVTLLDGTVVYGVMLALDMTNMRMRVYTPSQKTGGGFEASETLMAVPVKQVARVSSEPLRSANGARVSMAAGGGDTLAVTTRGAAAAAFVLHYATPAVSWSPLPEATVDAASATATVGMSALIKNISKAPVRLAKRVKFVDTAFAPAAAAAASQQQYARSIAASFTFGGSSRAETASFGAPTSLALFGASSDDANSVMLVDDDDAPAPAPAPRQEWEVRGLEHVELAPNASLLVGISTPPEERLVARAANVCVLAPAEQDSSSRGGGAAPAVVKSLVVENVRAAVPECVLSVRDATGLPLGGARLPRLCVGDGARLDYGVAQSFSVVRITDPVLQTASGNVRTNSQPVRLSIVWRPSDSAAESADVEVWVPIAESEFSSLAYAPELEAVHEKRAEPRRADARAATAPRVLHVFKLRFTRAEPARELQVSFVERGSTAFGASRG